MPNKMEKSLSFLTNTFNSNPLRRNDQEIGIENRPRKSPKELMENESWSDSDEELKAELKKVMIQYNKTEIVTETDSRSKTETLEHENREIPRSKNSNCYKNSNPTSTEKFNKVFESNTNGDAAEDIKNLINHFFAPTKLTRENSRPKTYAEYEKQGAIPKYRTFSSSEDVKPAEKVKKKKKQPSSLELKRDPETVQTPNSYVDNDIEKASEEICKKPFYYIVPENPSPKFFLPCGSYLVTARNPSSPDDKIIFHPERGEEKFKNEVYKSLKNRDSPNANDLGKVATQKMDSHLNIGPSDIKLTDFVENLEKSYNANKTYDKALINGEHENDAGQKSTWVVGHEAEEMAAAAAAPLSEERNTEKLNKMMEKLMSAKPDLSPEYCLSIATDFLNDEPGLENFIATERLTQKIQNQLQRLVVIFPDQDVTKLSEICQMFAGDEQLLENYIKEEKHLQKISQLVTDLLYMFPDADPDFLMERVQRVNGDSKAVSIFSEELLESKNYPKTSDDEPTRERRRLWKAYVTNFNVKNYLLNVPNPGDFKGEGTKYNHKEELVLRFLKSRYPLLESQSAFFLNKFINCGRNLTKTCIFLSSHSDPVKLIESSFQNEAFDENFLKEICYIENMEQIDKYLNEMRELKMAEKEEARLNDSFLSCPLCTDDEVIPSEVVTCPEGHVFCAECIKLFVNTKLADGVYKYNCPTEKCETSFTLATLTNLFPENIISNIVKKQQAEEISTAKVDGLELCPYCDFGYIPNPEDKVFKCQNTDCLRQTCRKCGEGNHIPLRCEEIENSSNLKIRKSIEEAMTQKLVRICPKCQKKFVKIDGCNKMVCTCGAVVCYICRAQVNGYSHFQGQGGLCPLYTPNEELHRRIVLEAGIATRNSLLQENPDIKLIHDPTKDF